MLMIMNPARSSAFGLDRQLVDAVAAAGAAFDRGNHCTELAVRVSKPVQDGMLFVASVAHFAARPRLPLMMRPPAAFQSPMPPRTDDTVKPCHSGARAAIADRAPEWQIVKMGVCPH